MNLATRSEKVDARAVLIDGDLGEANGTDRAVRERERRRIEAYWPEPLWRRMAGEGAPWRLLLDATRWPDRRDEVVAWVEGYREERGRWPSVDLLHRKLGRVSNHRGADEVEGQVSLGIAD